MNETREFLLNSLGNQLVRYFEFYGTDEDMELARRCVEKIRAEGDSDGVIQAWFQGMNPAINDWSPARLVVSDEVDQDRKWPLLLGAIDSLS